MKNAKNIAIALGIVVLAGGFLAASLFAPVAPANAAPAAKATATPRPTATPAPTSNEGVPIYYLPKEPYLFKGEIVFVESGYKLNLHYYSQVADETLGYRGISSTKLDGATLVTTIKIVDNIETFTRLCGNRNPNQCYWVWGKVKGS